MITTVYRGEADTGIGPADPTAFGPLGDIDALTVHHSAGPRATSKARAQQLHRAYQRHHIDQGWGDIGYHLSMDDHGRYYVLRDRRYKGAHTGGHNSGNIGLMIHGNYDRDKLTRAQKASLKWLLRGGLLILTGERERDIALIRGHQEWPGPTNQTACPGRNLMRHLTYLRATEFQPA